jgi:hypothetical protein
MENKNKEELMKTYLLFLYAFFKTHEEAEFFSIEVLGKCSVIKKVRFVIEDSTKNLIIIFESDSLKKELSEELHKILSKETVKFYFLFDRNNITSANLPTQMKEFMFKPQEEYDSLRLEYKDTTEDKSLKNMDLDTILEKLGEFGVESLTPDEKRFLDDFKN